MYITKNVKTSDLSVVIIIESKVVCEDSEERNAEEIVSYS